MRKLSAKWIWTIVVSCLVVVGMVATVAVLSVAGGRRRKNLDYLTFEVGQTAITSYVMGDEIDLSDLKIIETKKGVKFEHDVTIDMIELPDEGVDARSGLGITGRFLSYGDKKITIKYAGFTFEYDVSVEKDSIVSIAFQPNATLSVYENVNASDILDDIEVYAVCESGRYLKLGVNDYVVSGAYTGENLLDGNILIGGKIVKTNTTVYSQPFVLVVNYNHVDGLNLPTYDEDLPAAELENAAVVDSIVSDFEVVFDQDEILYRSVASRTDFVDVLPGFGTTITQDGQAGVIYFSDGKYLFEIVDVDGVGRAYSFVLDADGNPIEYGIRTHSNSYLVRYYVDGEAGGRSFLPFGDSYSVTDQNIPSSSYSVGFADENYGANRIAFLPSANTVYFNENSESVNINIIFEYETRTGEVWVADALGRNYTSTQALELDTISSLRRASRFYVVLGEFGYRYVSGETFVSALGGLESRVAYFNNYGFLDEQLVTCSVDGWYYDAFDQLVENANVTQVEAYYSDGVMVGYIISMPYVSSLKVVENAEAGVVLADGETYNLVTYTIERNGFVLKLTQSGSVSISAAETYDIDANLPVSLQQIDGTTQSGTIYAGDAVSLEGLGFVVALANGDEVYYNADHSVRYFETNHVWTASDSFIGFNVDATNVSEYATGVMNGNSNLWPVCFASGNVSFDVVYGGELNRNKSTSVKTTITLSVTPNEIHSVDVLANTLILTKDNFVDEEFMLYGMNQFFNDFTIDHGRNRFFCIISNNYAVQHWSDMINFRTGYGDCSVWVVYDFDATTGNAKFVANEIYDEQTYAYSANFTIIEQDYGVYHDDISLFGTQTAGENIGFTTVTTASVAERFENTEKIRLLKVDGANYWVEPADLFTNTHSLYLTMKNAISGTPTNGAYVIYGIDRITETAICMSYSLAPNGIANAVGEYTYYNDVIVYNNTLDGTLDKIPNANFANGAVLSPYDFKAQHVIITTLGGRTVVIPSIASTIGYVSVVSPERAPTTPGVVDVEFLLQSGTYETSFTMPIHFLQNITETVDKLYGLEDVFVTETGLENLADRSLNEFAFYRRNSAFENYKDNIDANTLLENALDRLSINVGVPFVVENGYMHDVAIFKDSNGYYVANGTKKYYIEENYVVRCYNVQTGSYSDPCSRVLVDTPDGARVLYVALNSLFDSSQPESESNLKYEGVIGYGYYVYFNIYDENNNVLDENVVSLDVLKQEIIYYSTSRTKIYLQAKTFLYCAGDTSWVGEVKSNKLSLKFFNVPEVTNANTYDSEFMGYAKLVESQALYLGSITTSARQTLVALAGNDRYFYTFPEITLTYEIDGDTYTNVASYSDLTFLPFTSRGVVGEIGYTISSDGKAILIGDRSGTSEDCIYINLKYRGIRFTLCCYVCFDMLVQGNYGNVSVVEGSNLFSGALSRTITNVVMLSGKKYSQITVANDGTALSGKFISLVMCEGTKDGVRDTASTAASNFGKLILGNLYASNQEAFRLYSFAEENINLSYYTMLWNDPNMNMGYVDKTFVDQLKTWQAWYFCGSYIQQVFGEIGFSYGGITLTNDRLTAVNLSGTRTKYAVDIVNIGLKDYYSLEGTQISFASGIQFTLPSANIEYYLVARSGDILYTTQTQTGDIVLRHIVLDIRSATYNGNAIDISAFSLGSAGSGNIALQFATNGGSNINASVSVQYVEGLPIVEAVYSMEGQAIDWGTDYFGQVVTKSEIANYIESFVITCSNVPGTRYIMPLSKLGLVFINNGINYATRNGGLGLYIEDSNFTLSDIVWGFDFDWAQIFTFTQNQDGTLTISAYLGSDSEVFVPSTYENKRVKTIASGAFSTVGAANNLITLTADNGIQIIEAGAFEGCSSLKTCILPSSVVEVGIGAFKGCSSLETLTLPFIGKTITTENAAYSGDELFGSIFGGEYYAGSRQINSYATLSGSASWYAPNSLRTVTILAGDVVSNAFNGCSMLTSVVIPTNAAIGSYAFSGCTGITSIEIPSGTQAIGNYAFLNCSSLALVKISSTVQTIGTYAFNGCSALRTVYIDSTAVLDAITSASSCGRLLANTTTVYAVVTNSYLENSYSRAYDGEYYVYTK